MNRRQLLALALVGGASRLTAGADGHLTYPREIVSARRASLAHSG